GRGDEAVRRLHDLVAGVEQHEAAGPVGVLRHAGAVAALAEQRRLLVAGDAGGEERLAKDAGGRHAGARGRRRDRPRRGRARGAGSSRSSWSSLSLVWMLKRSVREALETSVTWVRLPVSCQTSHVSTVPNASSPRAARSRAPGTSSSSHASLVPLKYGSMT